MASKIKTAFVLCAGLGTRLRPLTNTCPKPLLPFGPDNKPFVTYAFDKLIETGIERIIVNTHYLPEKFEELFPDKQYKGVELIFRFEPILLETGGGLKNIEDLVQEDENILIYNGDIYSDFSLQPLIDEHLQSKNEVTLVLRSSGGLCNVGIDKEGLVCDIRFITKIPPAQNCLFASIYTINTKFLKRLTPGKESVVKFWLDMLNEGAKINTILMDEGSWCDVGTLEEYYRMHEELGGTKVQ